jgi:xanthine dehydrogenase molybdopterin-binding subunit B
VAASDAATAEKAVRLIEVDYEELPAVFSIDEALKEGAPLVHEKLEGRKDPGYGRGGAHIIHDNSNILLHFEHRRGDVEEGFRAAELVFEDTLYFPSAQHYPMEPHVCVAHFEAETLTVWSATQSPFPVRQELARIFGLPFSGTRDRASCRRRLRRKRHQDRGRRCLSRMIGGRCASRSAPRKLSDHLPTARQDDAKTGVKKTALGGAPL